MSEFAYYRPGGGKVVGTTPIPSSASEFPYYHPSGGKGAPTWTDGYGVKRTAKQMSSDHLWNVVGYIRDRVKWKFKGAYTQEEIASALRAESLFYHEAVAELTRRGWLPERHFDSQSWGKYVALLEAARRFMEKLDAGEPRLTESYYEFKKALGD